MIAAASVYLSQNVRDLGSPLVQHNPGYIYEYIKQSRTSLPWIKTHHIPVILPVSHQLPFSINCWVYLNHGLAKMFIQCWNIRLHNSHESSFILACSILSDLHFCISEKSDSALVDEAAATRLGNVIHNTSVKNNTGRHINAKSSARQDEASIGSAISEHTHVTKSLPWIVCGYRELPHLTYYICLDNFK